MHANHLLPSFRPPPTPSTNSSPALLGSSLPLHHPFMAEWVPPPPPGHKPDPPPDPQPPPPRLTTSTYVVQVPKEQIYRVPPPENAILADKYRNLPPRQRPCFSNCPKLLIFPLMAATVIGIIVVIFYAVVRPKSPTLVITHMHVRRHQSTYDYDITLNSKNPNSRIGISYVKKDGSATLSYDKSEIATGKTEASKRSSSLQLSLHGSNRNLPHAVQKSFQGHGSKSGIPLSLSIHVPVRLKVGSMSMWAMNMVGGCDLRASSLANVTSIKSQDCKAKIKL